MNALNLFLLFFIATNSFAMEIDMPAETAVYRPSDLPGYQLVQKNCIACHSAQYVLTQPPDSSRSYWLATVHKMEKAFGAPIDEKEIPAMVDYLVKIYGSERLLTASGEK
jgi:sulfite dehydrogenase